jgi:hypothetical protein
MDEMVELKRDDTIVFGQKEQIRGERHFSLFSFLFFRRSRFVFSFFSFT